MEKGKKPRVSLCMIVKNEEKNLERALFWGKNILWEQIVVDTGSTDGTVALAKRLGAAVYHLDWTDDFSAARNFALDQATGGWILTLDADEWPAPETPERLLSLVKKAEDMGADGIIGQILNLNDSGEIAANSTRIHIFRNRREVRYRRRIHELLGFMDGREMKLTDAVDEMVFFHDGYAKKASEEKRKTKRNLRLLDLEYSDHPDDYEIMGYLGDEYRSFGETKKAKEWYERSVRHMPGELPETAPRAAKTLSTLISLYGFGGETEKAEEIYRLAVRLQPKDADFDYLLGSVYMGEERWQEAAEYLGQGLSRLETYGTANRSMTISANLKNVYENLGLCFLKSGKRKEAVQTAVILLQAEPYNLRALYVLLRAFYEDGGVRAEDNAYMSSVIGFLGKIYQLEDPKDRLFMAKAAKEAEWEAMRIRVEELER